MEAEVTVPVKTRTFEECYDEISAIIERKRGDWSFKASLSLDYDDIKQIICLHIWRKWHLFDQTRPLGGWVATVLKHQFANILRDLYLSTSSPCNRCPCNLGGNQCSLYGVQGEDCNLFKKWYNTKRHSHEIRLPLPIENHLQEVHEKPADTMDLEAASRMIHQRVQPKLTASEWEVYRRMYIQCLSEEETAKELGFKTSEKGRKRGYKRIRQIQTIIIKKVRAIVNDEGLF